MANVPYSTATATASGPENSSTPSGSSTNCSLTTITPSDLPYSFNNDRNPLCGLSYPNSSDPLRRLRACCNGAILVSNGCFQYCRVDEGTKEDDFQDCVKDHIDDLGERDFSVRCNQQADGEGNGAVGVTSGGGGKRWVLGVVLLGMVWMGGVW